jgi:chitinase
MFGPPQRGSSLDRPFGASVVDGFDIDIEAVSSNMAPFVRRLRSLMNTTTATGDKQYYLSVTPQCPYPDLANRELLNSADGVAFDFVMVQFYNNYCGVQSFVAGARDQFNFNLATWDDWAKKVSLNRNVRVFLGIPGNVGAGAGYVSGAALSAVLRYAAQFSSFGGVMLWDVSQAYANTGFLNQIVAELHGSALPPPLVGSTSTTRGWTSSSVPSWTTSAVQTTVVTRTTVTGSAATGVLVPLWGQCGGEGYRGPTQCAPGLRCASNSAWWSQCQ